MGDWPSPAGTTDTISHWFYLVAGVSSLQILLANSIFTLEMLHTYAQNVRGFWIRHQYLYCECHVGFCLSLLLDSERLWKLCSSRKKICQRYQSLFWYFDIRINTSIWASEKVNMTSKNHVQRTKATERAVKTNLFCCKCIFYALAACERDGQDGTVLTETCLSSAFLASYRWVYSLYQNIRSLLRFLDKEPL